MAYIIGNIVLWMFVVFITDTITKKRNFIALNKEQNIELEKQKKFTEILIQNTKK